MANTTLVVRTALARWGPRLCVAWFAVIGTFWTYHVIATRFECTYELDWVQFQDTARLFLSSRIHEIYPGISKNLPFFYPPYFIPLLAPLGLVSRPAGYTIIILSMTAALGAALWMLRSILPSNGSSYTAGVLVVLSSASWTTAVILGHFSALGLFFVVAGLFLWSRNQRVLAGVALSLLMFKPNLGLAFPLFVLVRRQWLVLAGWICGFALLLLSTLPLGPGIWRDYVNTYRIFSEMVGTYLPLWKQQTIYAFWRSALAAHQSPQILMLWLASVLPLLAITVAAWVKTEPNAEHLPRLFGLCTLALVCANFYVTIYDGLLLALPGMVWYTGERSYRSARCHLIGGIALLLIYLWQQVTTWLTHAGPAIVGPLVAVWLVAEAWDLLRKSAGVQLP
jgi:hypothetical protein